MVEVLKGHVVEQRKATSILSSRIDSLGELHVLDVGRRWENKAILCGTVVKFVALFIFTFSSGTEIMTKSILYLPRDFKDHFHIHYLIRTSGLLKVNNELTFTRA